MSEPTIRFASGLYNRFLPLYTKEVAPDGVDLDFTVIDEIDRVFGGDPWPYGIEANRPTLEAEVQYMAEQHYIAAPMPIEELFVPGVGA